MWEILEEKPELWEGWKAGKNKDVTKRRKKANEDILQELYARRCPTKKTTNAINLYVSLCYLGATLLTLSSRNATPNGMSRMA